MSVYGLFLVCWHYVMSDDTVFSKERMEGEQKKAVVF
jgi:hypothetical protein